MPAIAGAIGEAGLAGCAVVARRVRMGYDPSRDVTSRPRETKLALEPFLDRRRYGADFGRASTDLPDVTLPIRPTSDPAAWVTQAVRAELSLAGYELTPRADTRVGGELKEIRCGTGRDTTCSVKIQAWVISNGGWKLLDQEYSGDGIMPVLFGQDPYEQSLKDALQDALQALRKDVSRMVP